MNIYEFAMKMEKDGEQFYRDLSDKTSAKSLKSIFDLLANTEAKHYEIVMKLYQGSNEPDLPEDTLFTDVKNVFEEIKEEKDNFQLNGTEADLYKKALSIEEKSYDFYAEQAVELEGESQRIILLKLAEEEKRHMILMKNLMELVSRPQTWLENAEWNHLDEY